MSSSSRKSRSKRPITSASRRKSKKRKIVKRGTSPSHFLMSPQEELQYGPKYQVAVPGRLQIDQLLRAGSALYLKPREVPTGNTSSVYVSTDYDNAEYSSLDMLRSPLRFNVLDQWAPLEIALFEASICTFGKDFALIARHIGSKTTNECVEFYYTIWKHSHHYFIWKAHRQTCVAVHEERRAREALARIAAEKVHGLQPTVAVDTQGQTVISAAVPVPPTSPAALLGAAPGTPTARPRAASAAAAATEPARAHNLVLTPTPVLPPGAPVTVGALHALAALSAGAGVLEAAGSAFTRESSAALECVGTDAVEAMDALQAARVEGRARGTVSGMGVAGRLGGARASAPEPAPALESDSGALTWSELAVRTLAGPGSGEAFARRLALVQPLPPREEVLRAGAEACVAARAAEASVERTPQGAERTPQGAAAAAGSSKEAGYGLWSRVMGRAGSTGISSRASARARGGMPDASVALMVSVRDRGVFTRAPAPGPAEAAKATVRAVRGKLAFDAGVAAETVAEEEMRLLAPVTLTPLAPAQTEVEEAEGDHARGSASTGATVSRRHRRLLALDTALEPHFGDAYVDVYSTTSEAYRAMPVEEHDHGESGEVLQDNTEVVCETCSRIYPSTEDLYAHVYEDHFRD